MELERAEIKFEYDAMDNRCAKEVTVYHVGGGSTITGTNYVMDATGNVLSVYERNGGSGSHGGSTGTLEIKEQYIYGSARLGVYNSKSAQDATVIPTQAGISSYTHETGVRNYELSNHLNNVMAVISDKKQVVTDGSLSYFKPDLVAAYDYYPFGAPIEERTVVNDYRYGFNGAEKDDEVKGKGSHYDLGLRHYNPRIGRMFSIDPRAPEYPWQTSYAYHRNNPINVIDYLGGGDCDGCPDGMYENENGDRRFFHEGIEKRLNGDLVNPYVITEEALNEQGFFLSNGNRGFQS